MRQEKIGFGVIVRVFISFLPLLFGMPILSIIMCAYNISMSFIVFGPLSAFVSALSSICIAMLIGGTYGASGELSGLVLALQAVLASLGCIYGYLSKRKFSFGLTLCTAGILIPQFMYIQHTASLDGLSVAQAVVPSAKELFPVVSQTFTDMQITITAAEMNQISLLINKLAEMLLPSVFIVSSMVLAYVIIWSVSAQLRKLPFGMFHSFALIKLPRIMILFAIMTTSFLFISENIPVSNGLLTVIINMSVILLVICFFAGVSLVDFYLRKRVKFTFLRVIIHSILVLFIPIALIAYILLACIDSFTDFRRITHKAPIEKGELNETEK